MKMFVLCAVWFITTMAMAIRLEQLRSKVVEQRAIIEALNAKEGAE